MLEKIIKLNNIEEIVVDEIRRDKEFWYSKKS
jgi:hypothetical protein